MIVAPAATAGIFAFTPETRRTLVIQPDCGFGVHKYLYANADAISFSDPSGKLTLVETSLVSAAVGIFSTVISNAYKYADNPISPGEGLRQALVAGGIGAVSGVVSFQVSFFLKQFTLLSPWLRGAFTGAVSAGAGQFMKELVSWVEGKPITITGAGGRIFEASFGGFVIGGILSPLKVRFEKPVPNWIDVRGGVGDSANVVVMSYSNVSTVYSSAGMFVVPGLSVLQSVLKQELMNQFPIEDDPKP